LIRLQKATEKRLRAFEFHGKKPEHRARFSNGRNAAKFCLWIGNAEKPFRLSRIMR